MAHFWMVRAGEGGYLVNQFEKKGYIGIGWEEAGDFTSIKTIDDMKTVISKAYPSM